GLVGKTVLTYSRSYTWSSTEAPIGDEGDGNRFATDLSGQTASPNPTTDYGEGGFATIDPAAWLALLRGGQFTMTNVAKPQTDRSENISYLYTDYSSAYDDLGSTKGYYLNANGNLPLDGNGNPMTDS